MVKVIYWYKYRYERKAKSDFEKDFFKLKNSSVFARAMGNVRKHQDIVIVTAEKKKKIGICTKSSHNKVFVERFNRNRNEKKHK